MKAVLPANSRIGSPAAILEPKSFLTPTKLH